MIKNIVFDMGNVLTVYNAREYIYGYVDNEEDFRWIKNHLCASVEWLRMDRGTMTDEEAVRSVCRRVPAHLHDTVERFVREYRMVQPPNHPADGEAGGGIVPKRIRPVPDVKYIASIPDL